MAAMTPEAFVAALYRVCLGREPEPGVGWPDLLREHGDPTAILAAILASDEFRIRNTPPTAQSSATIAAEARRALDRPVRIVDIGAQLLGPHPYEPLQPYPPLEIIGFDPLAHRLAERASAEGTDGITLLPYAIGDGRTHTLYVNSIDATSSLFPLNTAHNAPFELRTLHTVETRTVQTRCLDEVLPPGTVDYLKLDVQGAELMVLKSGRQTLARTAAVHCEVEFAPIYEGQPLYPDIQTFLNGCGFELIDLVAPARLSYNATTPGDATQDRLLWAEAVFFRAVGDDPDTLRAQALIAAAIYGKPTLAAHLMSRARTSIVAGNGI
jgi:FkbM family methyltransferase